MIMSESIIALREEQERLKRLQACVVEEQERLRRLHAYLLEEQERLKCLLNRATGPHLNS